MRRELDIKAESIRHLTVFFDFTPSKYFFPSSFKVTNSKKVASNQTLLENEAKNFSPCRRFFSLRAEGRISRNVCAVNTLWNLITQVARDSAQLQNLAELFSPQSCLDKSPVPQLVFILLILSFSSSFELRLDRTRVSNRKPNNHI